MSFMYNNRRKNGAPQPEQVAAKEAPEQRAQKKLSPNPSDLGSPEVRTFEPNMETLEAINRRHYRGGLDEGQLPGYEDRVPEGPMLSGSNPKL